MKKSFSFLAATLLATALSASPLSSDQNFGNDFEKMQNYINSFMGSHLNTPFFSDINFPKVNISETKESYILKFDLAGVPKKDIKLTINEDNILSIEGERKSKTEEKEKSFTRQEIFYGSFKRSVALPQNANQEKLDTKYDNGILTLTIAKKVIDKPAPKVIEIK